MVNGLKTEHDEDFFISVRDKNGYLIYSSELYRLSEIDFINLIKICIIEARNKAIGKKFLAIYRDSTHHRQDLTQERLNMIGITENANTKPTKQKKPNFK